jgi:transposase-like protein
MCTNKPLVIVDRGPWYRWAFERLGLEYRHERFGMRNMVERFFRYLKERTIVFHHKMSAKDHIQGINNLFTIYYQAARTGRLAKMLIWTLSILLVSPANN